MSEHQSDMRHPRRPGHPTDEIRQVYERVLAGTSVRRRYLEVGAGKRVHVLEHGAGPPVVLLHSPGTPAGFLLPLLDELHDVRAIVPDRPGQGLSDPIDLPRVRNREAVVGWLDRLFDALELDTAALLGHSGGGMWALWYALARPDRVDRLVLIGPPAVPGARIALPIRLNAMPGVGELLSRIMPPSRKSLLTFVHHAARERETIVRYPDLIDLLVAAGRDRSADQVARAEIRMLVSPFGPLSRSGLRRRAVVRGDELASLAMPTLLIWGEWEPLGGIPVARAVTDQIPDARLVVLPAGHGPWLGQPKQTAAAIRDLVRGSD
jgi:pimeloyl-ACP methyl ester carboxylesterase